MADVVTQVGAKLGSALGDQTTMLCSFKDDMEDTTETLESMAAVLKDAERRSIKDETVRVWLKRLKDAAYDISDMLDESQEDSKPAGGKILGMLSCLPIVPKKIILANKMKMIRENLRKIDKERQSFNFTQSTSTTIEHQHYDQRETTSDVKEAQIIGMDEEKKAIINILLSANENKEETIIVPIYGLGGMGKSTLARLVYKDTQFKRYDNRVWVYVSQVFDLVKIGRSIISQFPVQGGQQNTDTLQLINRCLDNLLRGKKVLIVLDDIWEENDLELDKLRSMLGNKGNTIDVIVTTRSEDIAKFFFAPMIHTSYNV